jgi:hypothetical protein
MVANLKFDKRQFVVNSQFIVNRLFIINSQFIANPQFIENSLVVHLKFCWNVVCGLDVDSSIFQRWAHGLSYVDVD